MSYVVSGEARRPHKAGKPFTDPGPRKRLVKHVATLDMAQRLALDWVESDTAIWATYEEVKP